MSQPFTEREYEGFVRARMLFWKREAAKRGSETPIPQAHELEPGEDSSHFTVTSVGPVDIVGILEDSDQVGWLYLYEPLNRQILQCVHIYNRECVNVEAQDVDVVWSADNATCGVAVWGQFYAFLGISNHVQMRRPIQDKNTHGFYFNEWPEGFQHMLLREEDNKD